MKQAKTLQNTRFCLDGDCDLGYQIFWNSEDKEHNQHNRISSLEELCQYIKENQKAVDDLRLFYDLNKQSKLFDDQKIKVLNQILSFFDEQYREQQQSFTYIEQSLKTIDVILNRDLEGIEKLDNFAFLHDLKKLYEISEDFQQQKDQFQKEFQKELKKIIPKIDDFQQNQPLKIDTQAYQKFQQQQNRIIKLLNQQKEEIKPKLEGNLKQDIKIQSQWGSRIIKTLENDISLQQQSIINGETETGTGIMLIRQGEYQLLKTLLNGQVYQFQYDNGDYYEGKFKDGLKNGYGEITYKNKSNYKGQWLNDLKDGEGVMKLQNGLIYEGCFRKDMKHGQGELVFLNGDKFTGNFQEDQWEGYGEMSFGGQFYKGQFLNGQFHGKGELIDKNRDKYVGKFKKGLKNGYGEQYYVDGSVYRGQWQDDQKIGIGF